MLLCWLARTLVAWFVGCSQAPCVRVCVVCATPIRLILATVLETPNLLIIPGINIVIGAVVSAAIMLPFCLIMNVITFAPAVMTTSLIAMR